MKKNKIILLITLTLFLSISFMTIGYSAISSSLRISSNAVVLGEDNLEITNAQMIESSLAWENYNTNFDDLYITFHPNVSTPQAFIKYNITITNNSPVIYVYKGSEEIQLTNTNISYRLDGLPVGYIINPNESFTFEITINALRNNTVGTIELHLNFEPQLNIPTYEMHLSGAKSSIDSYVRTGIYPSSQTKIELSFTFLGPRGDSAWLFSSRRAYQNQMFGIAWNTTESLLQYYNVSYNLGSNGYKTGQTHIVEISKAGLIMNGKNYYDPTDIEWNSDFELYMFANNEARNVRGYTNGQAAIHYLKIYQNDVLVLDAIPVTIEGGVVAFWDKVNNTPLETIGSLIAVN